VLGTRRGVHGTALEKIVDSALGPICSVVLITGAGGMFGGVLRASGIGSALGLALLLGIVIFAAYLIAVAARGPGIGNGRAGHGGGPGLARGPRRRLQPLQAAASFWPPQAPCSPVMSTTRASGSSVGSWAWT
jgi:hypothetical protein